MRWDHRSRYRWLYVVASHAKGAGQLIYRSVCGRSLERCNHLPSRCFAYVRLTEARVDRQQLKPEARRVVSVHNALNDQLGGLIAYLLGGHFCNSFSFRL